MEEACNSASSIYRGIMEEIKEEVLEEAPQEVEMFDGALTLIEILLSAFLKQEDEADQILVIDYKKITDFHSLLKEQNTIKKIDSIKDVSLDFTTVFAMLSQHHNSHKTFMMLDQIFKRDMKSNVEFDYMKEMMNELTD